GKRKGIIYGPGRGSAAGALLAYAMRITELDPMKYDLLFERFLNPDRISMPDIDTDIQDTRRDEVIEYCTEKYGKGRVSNIATFGKMMAKNAVRDVARVLEVPYAEADRLAKMVPDPVMGHHVHLPDAIRDVPDLKNEYETNPTSKEVLDFASKLEGTIRGHGVHACGVVIAPDDLVKFVPLEVSAKGPIAAQFPMGTIEELGLLKMDFLGLSNLSVINNALRMVRKVYGEDIDMYSVPLDDPLTYKLLQNAETTGVFQLESAGMKRYLKDLKADHFEDIIAMVALYRPGPMQFIDSFIRRKHGEEPITYLHPGLKNSLKSTYGIMIYQEQFMQISREWCGFTGGQADTLRKAVGKKKVDLMNKVKPQFIEGAVKVGGATEEIAEEFWRELLDFANYCFNKSHAACYGLVSYWTAYLKAHYPDAYMAALMTSDMRWTDRLAIEIAECKRMGLKVLGPDVNESFGDFGIVKGEKTIRFGLSGIKGVGKALVEEKVIPERTLNGPFKSVCNFAKRVDSTKFNKKAWESTIKTGGFDRFGTRSDILYNLEAIQAYGAKMQKDAASGQTDLFGAFGAAAAIPEVEIKPAPAQFSEKEQLLWERDLMGLYISAHPLDKYDKFFEEQTHPFSTVSQENDGKTVVVGGIITAVRTILTKSNTKMAFVKIENKTSEQEIIVFPSVFEEYGGKLVQDNVVKITGRVNAKDKNGNPTPEVKVLMDSCEVISDEVLANYQETGTRLAPPKEAPQFRRRSKGASEGVSGGRGGYRAGGASFGGQGGSGTSPEPERVRVVSAPKDTRHERVYVLVKDPNNVEQLMNIKRVCDRNSGFNEVVLVLQEKEEKKALKMPFRVEVCEEFMKEMAKIVGEDGVKVK
ncbi:DNA polymerase III subunit alpha, partial [Candidatus Saccharibacteria bacterium]|nr:DNA polymerase III subunit alpha [Candidatus Saccharibacteria bacterium]